MSKHMEFYIQDYAASTQIGKNVYRRVSIPIDDFNAACDHYGFVKERTCQIDYERHCSNCGVYVRDEAVLVRKDLDDGGWTAVPKPVSYCPNCGAKVVGE